MSNPQAVLPSGSPREVLFRQGLAAAFKARRQLLPQMPMTLDSLLDSSRLGVPGLLGKPGCHRALSDIQQRLFHIPGRQADAESAWAHSLATAVFAARLAELTRARTQVAFGAGLLHRAGEALALQMLARVELEYRMTLERSSSRDWVAERSAELADRLVRVWQLPADIGNCMLAWGTVGAAAAGSAEGQALYFGRLLALELLQPEVCVPGALEAAAADLGLKESFLGEARLEASRVQHLIRVIG